MRGSPRGGGGSTTAEERRKRSEWPHSVTAVVLAAGGGSRLRPLTKQRPKEMIRFWGKPVLHYILDNISMARIREAVLVVSPEKEEAIKGYFRQGRRVGVRLSYALQTERRGPADAIVAACSSLESEYILVQYGDSLADENIPLRLMEELEHGGWKSDGALALRKVDEPRRYGVARLERGKVVEVVEKPETPPSDLAVMGTFVMKTAAFLESVKGARFEGGRAELFPAQYMLRMGASFEGWVFRGERVDVGTPENLFDGSLLTRKILKKEGKHVPKVEVVIFDSDNTLLRTREVARAADMGAMEVLSSRVGRPSEELYEEWMTVVGTVSSSTDPPAEA